VSRHLALAIFTFAVIISAPTLSDAEEKPQLVVGIKEAPPFVIQRADGRWSGLSIELWRAVAAELGVEFTLRDFELDPLLNALEAGDIDVAVGALTILEEREEILDFTNGYFVSSLGIAVPAHPQEGWLDPLAPLLTPRVLTIVLAVAALVALVGILVWWLERKRNPEQFGGNAMSGLGIGFWWSAVTMTTVGYGDKAPKTAGGRAVALLWMYISMVLVSVLIGAIASALTVSDLSTKVGGPEDLPNARVASVADTASGQWLQDKYIGYVAYPDLDAALEALRSGYADAVVYDMPILSYRAQQSQESDFIVLPRRFALNLYGFALPQGSPRRESINREILGIIEGPNWSDTVYRYLGEEP
jgi:ABC-type amino acid transport substrate-binding protein